MPKGEKEDPGFFEAHFPNITAWVTGGGWVEIGVSEPYTGVFVRALDEGGTAFEGKTDYPSVDDAMQDLEAGISAWYDENS